MTQTTDKTRATFTPGPWEPYDAADGTGINIGQVAGDGIIVAEQVQPRDAHLIALAPEMAEMLRVLVGTLGHREAYEVESGRWDDEDSATMEQARHLLARLDGDV